jgi:hypothetical protein
MSRLKHYWQTLFAKRESALDGLCLFHIFDSILGIDDYDDVIVLRCKCGHGICLWRQQ